MLFQESFLGEALHSKNMQEAIDEADETLSLCDLPLYGDQSVEEWEEDLSAESQGSTSISSSEQDYFEFFSHELSPSTTSFPPENIIFCGKLIPYKQADSSEDVSSKGLDSKKQTSIKKKRGWGIFGWKFSSSRSSKRQVQSKHGKKSTTLVQKKDHHQSSKKTYTSNKHGKGYDFPVDKMSILTSSSSGKARWYLFLFGISSFSREMDLRDIKNRQSRRRCSPPSPTLRYQSHHDEVVGGGANSGSGLWGLIKVLSCGRNHHPNTMVVGPISSTRRE